MKDFFTFVMLGIGGYIIYTIATKSSPFLLTSIRSADVPNGSVMYADGTAVLPGGERVRVI